MAGPVDEPRDRQATVSVTRGIGAQTIAIARLFRLSDSGGRIFTLAFGLVVVIGATAYEQIALNAWNEPFYDAINRRDVDAFGVELGVYAVIAGALLCLNVAQTWLNQTMKLQLRDALTRDLFAQWLAPKRAMLLADAGAIGVNPDQRIDEDSRRFTELSTDLGVGLFQAALLLACFIGVLWTLSAGVVFHWAGASYAIPGYMVWSALFYAAVASFASWFVGRPLVGLNAERYARESDLRFSLVRVNENCEGVAAYRGEAQERRLLIATLERLLAILRQLVSATTRLTWVTAGYGWFTIIAPIIVAAPAYFGGNLTFGGMLMAAGAFTQVQQSLRWFVDNAGLIADWRATLQRVCDLREALFDADRSGAAAGRIAWTTTQDGRIRIDDVNVAFASGHCRLSDAHVSVAPGERVLIVGGPASGKTRLFRALAGLWPHGEGRIELPAEGVAFMPKHPYAPPGSLRDILAYPSPPEKFASDDCATALTRMGLAHLAPALDEAAPWQKDLTDLEQQSLAFARILLHKPRWVIVDTAIDTLTADARERMIDVFRKELSATALVAISGVPETFGFFDRQLTLVRRDDGASTQICAPCA